MEKISKTIMGWKNYCVGIMIVTMGQFNRPRIYIDPPYNTGEGNVQILVEIFQ